MGQSKDIASQLRETMLTPNDISLIRKMEFEQREPTLKELLIEIYQTLKHMNSTLEDLVFRDPPPGLDQNQEIPEYVLNKTVRQAKLPQRIVNFCETNNILYLGELLKKYSFDELKRHRYIGANTIKDFDVALRHMGIYYDNSWKYITPLK